jgi:hypothetical protein
LNASERGPQDGIDPRFVANWVSGQSPVAGNQVAVSDDADVVASPSHRGNSISSYVSYPPSSASASVRNDEDDDEHRPSSESVVGTVYSEPADDT